MLVHGPQTSLFKRYGPQERHTSCREQRPVELSTDSGRNEGLGYGAGQSMRGDTRAGGRTEPREVSGRECVSGSHDVKWCGHQSDRPTLGGEYYAERERSAGRRFYRRRTEPLTTTVCDRRAREASWLDGFVRNHLSEWRLRSCRHHLELNVADTGDWLYWKLAHPIEN